MTRFAIGGIAQRMMKVIISYLPCLCLVVIFVDSTPAISQTCRDRFIEHTLPHITTPRGEIVRFFESNGSGLAINDLNNDGLLDIVLGNLDGANTLLWNEGGLQFRAESFMPTGRTRAINIVDVDGDGWLDIVMTTQTAAPRYLHNNRDETFSVEPLTGVRNYANVMQWADVDADGDLDLVTASYDAELSLLLGSSFLFNGGGGVYYYENQDGTFVATQLADAAQALAIWLSDLDGDGTIDLFIGNDFSLPDQSWSYVNGAWQATTPFNSTSFSTMSFDIGDINNDRVAEFFSADMYPYEQSDEALRPWQRVLSNLEAQPVPPNNIQQIQNTLLFRDETTYSDFAHDYAVSASGWSWSSKFGDLNQDGFLDLYVVNGMIAQELFANLPDDELVEANQVFRNVKGGRFVPMPEWGLDSQSSGRGMSMADLDNDGDLDIIINNLNAPAQLYENDLCGGQSLQVDLRWQDSANVFGIGAILRLETTSGTYSRDVRSGSGYLSGDPARIHFGFPADAQPLRLEVLWTDGEITTVDSLNTDHLITLTR